MTTQTAVVAFVFLLTVVGILGCVAMMQHAETTRDEALAAEKDEEAKQRAATDALRVKGETDAALDADLARALRRPPPDNLGR